MPSDVRLPGEVWRVDFYQDYGYPERDLSRRIRTKRTYERPEDAALMVDTITGHPTHHELIAVHRGSVSWSEVDPDLLPRRVVDVDVAEAVL